MDNLDISYFCKTKSQAKDFSSRIDSISEMIYQTNFSLERALNEQLGIQKKDQFIALLRENKVNLESRTSLKEFIASLQEKISSLPVLSLIIAFEPTDLILQNISQWFLVNIKKQVLFDIKVDTNIIAGAAITFNGKYKDYSIRNQFQEIIKQVTNPDNQLKNDTNENTHRSMEHLHLGR